MNSEDLRREAYDKAAAGGVFSLAEVALEIEQRAEQDNVVAKEILSEWAWAQAKMEDRRRALLARVGMQSSFLDDDEDALDGVWSLGNDQRVSRRRATLDNTLRHLELVTKHADDVAAALVREQARVAEILPYFTTDRTTLEEAIRAAKAATRVLVP